MNAMRPFCAEKIARWPPFVRGLLGCCAAALAAGLTYSISPLRAFPLLLGLPTVVLSAWYLGMPGGVFCALTEATLVDLFLTKSQVRFSTGDIRETLRLTTFLVISILLGWTIRRLARQRIQLENQKLQQQLDMANAERMLAEERARASEKLRDRDDMLQVALQANGMGLWVWDLQQDTIWWSDEVYRMFGREPGSIELPAEAWLQLIHPDDVAGVKEALTHTRENAAEYQKQYRVLFPDGSVHWLESQGKCQRDSENRVTRVLGVVTDISHRKRVEESMLRAEKLAVAGRLAASVAHEINNPMEAVSNLLYLITLTETIEDAHSKARHALEELMRAAHITHQTLKFHRQDGKPKPAKLSELVRAVLTLFRGRLQATQIEVEVRTGQETMVPCMPSEIQQIFANLVSNAIDAMPRSGRLVVKLHHSHDWRDRRKAGMRVTFCDSGTGMDRTTMRRMFEPFFTTKTETGTGLGMWVVTQLVERHHGQVRAWSTQRTGHSGTAFSVFLPFGDQLKSDPPAEALAPSGNGLHVENENAVQGAPQSISQVQTSGQAR
jgi:PAS domain S-box-containing protein